MEFDSLSIGIYLEFEFCYLEFNRHQSVIKENYKIAPIDKNYN
ncbi:hypothetical protein D1BOALGB6SA_4689 [Olavius sp. associated proteobacterium Delta 1]|nr:hypothetical protein D1BOALGB6SA_4689 [Olavius sp. associated proteobacterium Delta 1]